VGEQVDVNEGGAKRRIDDAYASESVIHADIAWKGSEAVQPARRSLSAVAGNCAQRSLEQDLPIERVIVGSSEQAQALREQIRAYAEDTAPVLIIGETGAGKELVARELHRLSSRCERPFIALNAGAIPETLAAAELFGHTKGAFTGAVAEREGAFIEANGGVLFLDEIGDTPLSIQAQLLRVLDDGVVTKIGARKETKVDFRLIAATNVDLQKSVAEGRFRRDLYYRIDVLVIEAPPLRERGDDVIEIAESMIRTHRNPKYRKAGITPNAADRLRSHHYPGNVRELSNILARALVHARGGKILAEHITFSGETNNALNGLGFDIPAAKELIGKFILLKALKLTNGNVSRAAELAGRSRGTVHALKKELEGEDFAGEYEAACAQLRALIEN
jgi:DNA-binding NtrC family response regulator